MEPPEAWLCEGDEERKEKKRLLGAGVVQNGIELLFRDAFILSVVRSLCEFTTKTGLTYDA